MFRRVIVRGYTVRVDSDPNRPWKRVRVSRLVGSRGSVTSRRHRAGDFVLGSTGVRPSVHAGSHCCYRVCYIVRSTFVVRPTKARFFPIYLYIRVEAWPCALYSCWRNYSSCSDSFRRNTVTRRGRWYGMHCVHPLLIYEEKYPRTKVPALTQNEPKYQFEANQSNRACFVHPFTCATRSTKRNVQCQLDTITHTFCRVIFLL